MSEQETIAGAGPEAAAIPPAEAAPPAAGSGAPTLWTRLGPAALLGLAWAVMPAVLGMTVFFGMRGEVAEWLRAQEAAPGMAVYIGAFVVCAGLGLLPTWTQATIGGYAFGLWGGFLGALAGFTGASVLGYGVARVVARKRVEAELERDPRAKAVRDALVGRGFWRTLGAVALLRFPPNSPFALMNLAMSATRVPLGAYVLGTAIGMAPRTLAYAWIGTRVSDWDEAGVPKWLTAAGAVSMLVVAGIVLSIAHKAVERVKRGYAAVSSA